jgi:hypothetical protein
MKTYYIKASSIQDAIKKYMKIKSKEKLKDGYPEDAYYDDEKAFNGNLDRIIANFNNAHEGQACIDISYDNGVDAYLYVDSDADDYLLNDVHNVFASCSYDIIIGQFEPNFEDHSEYSFVAPITFDR